MIAVGKILKPHGIRGDLKVESFMDSPVCFIKIKKIFIENVAYKIEKSSEYNGFVIIKIFGINDMTSAESFRDRIVYCDEEDLPKPEEGRFYISDLIGCIVSDGVNSYGKITEILQYGSADIVVTKNKGKKYMFPWLKSLECKIDIDSKIFLVNPEKLSEVLLDED